MAAAIETRPSVTVDELIGMPWDQYMAELVDGWRDAEAARGLRAMRLAPTLEVYRALLAGQDVPKSALDPLWEARLR